MRYDPNSNIPTNQAKSVFFMKQIDWILSRILTESLRDESIFDLWNYYYKLHDKGIHETKVIYLILWESILFIRLSLKISIQEYIKSKRFNPTAELRLRNRFLDLHPDDLNVEIPSLISWDEYGLFLNDQKSGKFYSQANIPNNVKKGIDPVTQISIEDAHWFCAWLSMKARFHPELEGKIYDFRFILTEEGLKVTRIEIPLFYDKLQKYLSYGDWSSADKEYSNMTLVLTKRENFEFLSEKDMNSISLKDIAIFDSLWRNFSGGKFGLTVQIEIYNECKKRLPLGNDDEIFKCFEQEIGWRDTEGEWINFKTDVVWSLNACIGHLPCKRVSKPNDLKRKYVVGLCSLGLPPAQVLVSS
ncbi:MAG: hypothetical protein GPJ14_13170 [Microcystis aeruginosa G11-01]|nr:hypothetical protein [Microcystis aeruginosa G11-01]